MFDQLQQEARSITTAGEFKHWLRSAIHPVFPHAAVVCGYGHMHAGGVALDCVVTDNFPVEHLKNICNKAGGLDTPILRRWIATQVPQLFEVGQPWDGIPETWFRHFRNTGLKNIAAHAVYDAERCVGTYHSFYDVPGRPGEEHAEALRQLCPVIHEVLCGVVENLYGASNFNIALGTLTKREREVARWIGLGKTNREIADIICLSEITVKHHLVKIFAKLHVVNRAQLMSRLAEHQAQVRPEYGLKLL